MPELPPDFPHDKFDYGDGKNIATTFVTPIAHYSNTEFLEELKSHIINDDKSEESGISPDIKHNLYESKFDLLQRDVEVIKTAGDWFKQCMKHAFNYMEQAPNMYDINFRDSWYHITKTNGTHAGHTHQNCSWCGIYYIDVGDNNSGHTLNNDCALTIGGDSNGNANNFSAPGYPLTSGWKFGHTRFYTAALSATQITQNWSAERSIYGL